MISREDRLEALKALSSEANEIGSVVLNMMTMADTALRSLHAIQARIAVLANQEAREPNFEISQNSGFGAVENPGDVVEDANPAGMTPQTHHGRETVTAACPQGVVAGVGEGSDAQAPAGGPSSAVYKAQSEQAVATAAPGISGAAEPATIFDAIVDRYAETGLSAVAIGYGLSCAPDFVTQALGEARVRNDPRMEVGDVLRADRLAASVDGRELPPEVVPASRDKVRRRGQPAAVAKPEGLALHHVAGVAPDQDDVGLHLAEVSYKDGLVRNLDTLVEVTLRGPALRMVARLKDQRVHAVEGVWKWDARYGSESIFRSELPAVQSSLAKIGLVIAEIPGQGLQLRKTAE